ncbi:synaptic vesicle glycoprotein 2B-like isoform X1 [Leptopilina heterotoma]|uniref:synaptic vesicle glycoprotein 2B-like isoform X1 n=1 Tax=Leptopilina heterotoma TaxID=63436 RepID=UPI001CA7FFB1|nr:synaptic vesicle glycoprotein 2B-like isoform X1 [Leptopilina heterotoma]
MSNSKTFDKKDHGFQNSNAKGSNFETAVTACGYGKFHYILYLVMIPATWASIFDTSNTSMILPSVQCDLGLTPLYKGLLNAAVYSGMVSSAFLWGFLGDVLGRKKILIYCLFVDGVLNFMTGTSQTFWVLVFFKFMSGFVVSGPYASLVTYCSEFHALNDRPRLVLLIGMFNNSGAILNAAMAWLIIPHKWSIILFNGNFVYNSWRLYMSFCGLPIIIGAACFLFFPESPKFLMSQGRNDEALQVFRKIYAMNSGQSPDSYPIRELESEVVDTTVKNGVNIISIERDGEFSNLESNKCHKRPFKSVLMHGMRQMKPLFVAPLGFRLLLVVTLNFGILMTLNTIRLWQPQIFTILTYFDNLPNKGPEELSFCEILDNSKSVMANQTIVSIEGSEHCKEIPVDSSVYYFAMIVSSVTTSFVFLAALLVSVLRNKILLLISLFISFISIVTMQWSPNTLITLIITCIYSGVQSACVNLSISITVDLFPTTLRTMAVSLIMMTGRIGALLGNIMFPVLLEYGCFVPIIALAFFILLCIVLTFFIPKPNKNLK